LDDCHAIEKAKSKRTEACEKSGFDVKKRMLLFKTHHEKEKNRAKIKSQLNATNQVNSGFLIYNR